ncbi:MAG TPA: CAP domain-containing protein [Solirubrobacteraceae bacterium]|nr:CAP domain-containing protein [Solirubrobacteraceae bacterium]
MARPRLIALLCAVAAALCAAPAAQARTPCPGEQVAPTAAGSAAVSDAVFCLSNQIRAHFGLPAFRRDVRLDAAAALHSLDMGVRGFFDHVNPDGLDPTARAAAQGYGAGAGENIAYGYGHARALVLGWMASAGHCRNLLGGAADLGVGTAVSGGRPYYTQALGDHFSRPVADTARNGCPYALNVDALAPAAPAPAGDESTPARARPAARAAAEPVAVPLSLHALRLSPRRFSTGGRGTKISFRLSAPGTVTFTVTGRGRGRSLSRRFTRRGKSGANRLRLKTEIGRKVLHAGRYRLAVVAENAAGRSTRVVRSSFVVTRR